MTMVAAKASATYWSAFRSVENIVRYLSVLPYIRSVAAATQPPGSEYKPTVAPDLSRTGADGADSWPCRANRYARLGASASIGSFASAESESAPPGKYTPDCPSDVKAPYRLRYSSLMIEMTVRCCWRVQADRERRREVPDSLSTARVEIDKMHRAAGWVI